LPVTVRKTVHDSVHGSVRFDDVFLPLIECPELQRLHSIHQLGLAYLVYPGANHTRFEHSIGTFAVATKMCSSMGLEPEDARLVRCAALLHDVGHLPYSHTLEYVLHDRFGIDHAEVSRRLIRGEDSVLSDTERRLLGSHASIPEVLESHGVDPAHVASLLQEHYPGASSQKTLGRHRGQAHFNSKRYMAQMVNGPVDADQLDYLVRDARYTGVAYGVIDLERMLGTMEVFNGDLAVDRSGLSAVEGVLVARALMFSSVYFHKTVRISELMLAKAVEQLSSSEIQRIHATTDPGLLSYLVGKGGYMEEVATLIKYRRLFKKAFAVRVGDLSPDMQESVDALARLKARRAMEKEIADKAGIDPGQVIIDVPSAELAVSEPRLGMTDVRILDGNKVRFLHKMSSIAASLQWRKAHEWALMVACPKEHAAKVSKASAKVVRP
jgi:HD superfamily phosphohydrolase